MGKWISTVMLASMIAFTSTGFAANETGTDTDSATEDTNADGGVAWGQWRIEVEVNGGNRVVAWLPIDSLELFVEGTETWWDTALTEDVYANPEWSISVPMEDWTHTKLNLDDPIVIEGHSQCGSFQYELEVSWIEFVLHGRQGSVPLPTQASEDGECVYAPTLSVSLEPGFYVRRPSRD